MDIEGWTGAQYMYSGPLEVRGGVGCGQMRREH